MLSHNKTYDPPNSCMPSKANISMNKNKRNNKLRIDFMLLSNDAMRFFKEPQYLKINKDCFLTRTDNISKLGILKASSFKESLSECK